MTYAPYSWKLKQQTVWKIQSDTASPSRNNPPPLLPTKWKFFFRVCRRMIHSFERSNIYLWGAQPSEIKEPVSRWQSSPFISCTAVYEDKVSLWSCSYILSQSSVKWTETSEHCFSHKSHELTVTQSQSQCCDDKQAPSTDFGLCSLQSYRYVQGF